MTDYIDAPARHSHIPSNKRCASVTVTTAKTIRKEWLSGAIAAHSVHRDCLLVRLGCPQSPPHRGSGATAPSIQSGAVLLELSRPRMRDSGRDQLPPDVRFAGKSAEMRAPPWITVRQHSLLTETPSCEAGHMTCTRPRAESQKSLDAWVPSTHDPFRTWRPGYEPS
jgi:hypothetical protein